MDRLEPGREPVMKTFMGFLLLIVGLVLFMTPVGYWIFVEPELTKALLIRKFWGNFAIGFLMMLAGVLTLPMESK